MVGSAYINNQPFRSTRPVIQLLLVEDSQVDSFLLSEALENDPISRFSLTVAERLRDGLQQLKQQHFDVVLLDFGLPDSQGLSTFEKLHQQAPDVPVVVLSGTSDEQLAIQAVQAGAQDYLVKGQIGWNSVARAVRYAIERQQNRSALDNSEKRFRALIENSADGIAMLRVDGTMFFVSPASLHILGYSPNEMEGVNVLDLVYPEDVDAANRLMDQVVEQHRTPITGQLRVHNKNGDWLWLEITVTNLLDEPGVEGVVANYRDVTQRRNASEALRQSEERFRRVIENIPDVVVLYSADLRIQYINSTIQKVTGIEPSTFIGRRDDDLFPIEVFGDHLRVLHQALNTRMVSSGEFELFGPDHGSVALQTTSIPLLDQNGEVREILSILHDITEHRTVETALEEQVQLQSQLANVAATVPGMIFTLRSHPDGSVSMPYASAALEDLYGLRHEAVVNDASFFFNMGHPDDTARIGEAVAVSARDLTPLRAEWRVPHPSRGEIWVECNSMPSRAADGSITWQGFVQDITERKQAEQALRDQEAQYRAVIASSSDSFCMLDRQGRVIEVNETFVRQSGFSEDDLLSMSASQVEDLMIAYPKDAVEKPVKTLTFMETIAQTGSALFETQLPGKNKALWPVEISVSYRPIHGGRFFVFIRDISERKKANNALLQRTNELALLLEAGRALTSSLDLKEIFSQLYHFIARSVPCDAILISSYDRDEGLIRCRYVHDQQGECDTSAFPPIPYDPQGGDPQSLVITNGAPLLLPEYQGQQTAGHLAYGHSITEPDTAHDWRMRSTMLVPLIVEGKIAGVLQVLSSQAEAPTGEHLQYLEALVYRVSAALANAGLFQQVQTELLERRRAEEEVRQLNAELEQRVHERTADLSRANAGLEQAARAKDEFLASMSHELRTPLNAILTLTESLEEGTYTPVNDRQIPPLRTIAESGHHLLNLINDILDLSKIEAGKLSLIISRVEVEPVCQASMRLVRQMAQKKRLQITFEYDPSVVYLHADPRCMKQMLVNLLSNAVKFTPEGGEIGLKVKADRAQGAAHFTIWDNGIGISHEHVSLLFKPFSQVDRGLDRQYGGTGLGLSLVYRMAELHGGSVSVESKPGEGSRFTISLPWSDPQTGELKAPPLFSTDALAANGARRADGETARGHAARPVILLAEDNYANQQTYSDYLSAHGYQVIWAANGAEAIERAHETRPDLILMDVQMPGMDGLEATRRLRLDAHLSAVPIIALTALVMPGDRERCLSTGASDYLTKPVRLINLVEVIEIHLKGKPNETNPSHR